LKSLKRNSSVRRTAWDAIEKNGSEEALSLLLPALQEKSPGIRREALAIFASTESYPSFLDDLAARVRKEKSEQVLVALVKALEIYSAKFNAAVDPLNRLVVSRNKNIQILATLAAAWPGNTTIFAELLKRAKGSANPAVRSAAIVGLARMDAKKALPVLKRIRRKKGSKSSLSRVLDLAIARLEGDDSVSKDLDCERDRLKSEAGSGDDRENEAWRNRTERRRKPPGRF